MNRSVQLSLILGLGLAGLLAAGGGLLLRAFSDDPEVLRSAELLFPAVVLIQPLNSLAFVWDGILYGVGGFGYAPANPRASDNRPFPRLLHSRGIDFSAAPCSSNADMRPRPSQCVFCPPSRSSGPPWSAQMSPQCPGLFSGAPHKSRFRFIGNAEIARQMFYLRVTFVKYPPLPDCEE